LMMSLRSVVVSAIGYCSMSDEVDQAHDAPSSMLSIDNVVHSAV
jgi:hypothetical protein